MTHPGSTYEAVEAMVRGLKAAVRKKERMPQTRELIALIESGPHLLVGAKALAFYTEPRFTEDSDYIVSGQTFRKIRKWAKDNGVEPQDLGLVLRFLSLGVDVIDVRSNAVFKELMKREKKVPSAEGLAAAKYISMVNQQRGERRRQDAVDFAQLVCLPKFETEKLRSFLVEVYQDQWPQVAKLIDDIKNGRPIAI